MNIPAEGGTFHFTITSNTSWTIRLDDNYSFVQLSSLSGTGNASIEITALKNNTPWDRRAFIEISAGNRHSTFFNLIQAPGEEIPAESNMTKAKVNPVPRRK